MEALQADILIVQECEDPSQSNDSAYERWAGNHLWSGKTKHRGIGIFVPPNFQFEREAFDVVDLELFLPCRVNGFPLVGVWTQRAKSQSLPYIGQLWKFLQSHRQFLDDPLAMVIGDLNSNVQWDKRGRFWNHSDVVRELSEIGLRSAYHEQRRIDRGSEPDPTFFLQRNLQKYYHIDYAFVGSGWNLEDVNVGHHLDWLSISDHMPMRLKLSKRSKISESD